MKDKLDCRDTGLRSSGVGVVLRDVVVYIDDSSSVRKGPGEVRLYPPSALRSVIRKRADPSCSRDGYPLGNHERIERTAGVGESSGGCPTTGFYEGLYDTPRFQEMELYSRWVNLCGMPETPEHSPDISIPRLLESSPGPGQPSIVMSAALYSMQSGWVYKCMWR